MTNKQNLHITPEAGWKGFIQNWRADFLAAVSVSLVALPLGLGIAVASGVPPISGLISAIIGGIVVTFFRGSHLAINGPAAGLIAVIISALISLNDGTGQAFNYVLAATCVAGAIQVLLGVFRLGYIAELIPSSVIQGIMVAIGIIIFTSQIYVALGITAEGSNTVENLLGLFRRLPETNPAIAIISVIGLLLLIFIPKINSRLLHYFPATLWVLILSIPVVYIFNFFEPHILHIFGNNYAIGPEILIQIPDDLTKAIIFPNFSKINTFEFWLAAISITLIASIQTLAMAKAVDKLDPFRRKSNLNKDLIGVGIGTMVSGAIGGLPIITVIVRSTVNITNNAKTKWSNFYHGILIILFLFLLAPVIQKVPLAALAIILVYIGFRLASPKVFRNIYSSGIEQLLFMSATIVITLYTDLLWGIIGGTLFTLMVQVLLARLPARKFLQQAIKGQAQIYNRLDGNLDLRIRGIANFLTVPKLNKLTATIPKGKDVHIDLSETRLVGLSFMEKIFEFVKSQNDTGGNVAVLGLDKHVSSSTNSKALKIFLNPVPQKLSPRQERLQEMAGVKGYSFETELNWNTSYLKNFRFFETRPIERKSNCMRGSFENDMIQWEIADVIFNEGAAFTAEVFHSTVMTLRLNKPIPKFVMEKEGLFDKIFDRVMAFTGYKDIDFEMYTSFSSKFLLMGEDEREIRSFFDTKLIRFFESSAIYHIESNGEALMIFYKLKLARTDETEKLLEFSEALVKRIYTRQMIQAAKEN